MTRNRRTALAALGTLGTLGVAAPAAWWANAQRRRKVARAAPALQGAFPAGQLAVVKADGLTLLNGDGSTRRLAPPPASGWFQDPVWSPDGTQLVYARIEWPVVTKPVPGEVPW